MKTGYIYVLSFVLILFVLAQLALFTALSGQEDRLETGHSRLRTASICKVYATYVPDEESIDPALVLRRSLAQHSACVVEGRCKTVAILSDKITGYSKFRLAQEKWDIINRTSTPCNQTHVNGMSLETYGSFSVFTFMTEYCLVTYLSASSLITGDIDQLFFHKDKAAFDGEKVHASKDFSVARFVTSYKHEGACEKLLKSLNEQNIGFSSSKYAIARAIFSVDVLNNTESVLYHFTANHPWINDVLSSFEPDDEQAQMYVSWWKAYQLVHTSSTEFISGTWDVEAPPVPKYRAHLPIHTLYPHEITPLQYLWVMRGTQLEHLRLLSGVYAQYFNRSVPGSSLIVGGVGDSCDVTCRAESLECSQMMLQLPVMHDCDLLVEIWDCEVCIAAPGIHHPLLVEPPSATVHSPKRCMVTSLFQQSLLSDCEAGFSSVRRLCPCVHGTSDKLEKFVGWQRKQFGDSQRIVVVTEPEDREAVVAEHSAEKALEQRHKDEISTIFREKEKEVAYLHHQIDELNAKLSEASSRITSLEKVPAKSGNEHERRPLETAHRPNTPISTANIENEADHASGKIEEEPTDPMKDANGEVVPPPDQGRETMLEEFRAQAKREGRDFQSSRHFTDMVENEQSEYKVKADVSMIDNTNWVHCDPTDAIFTGERDKGCLAYMSNANNVYSITAMSAVLSDARTIKFRVKFRHGSPRIEAIMKIPQNKFKIEPHAEILGYTIDRLFGINRVPPTTFFYLPIDWLMSVARKNPPLYEAWVEYAVLDHPDNAPLIKTENGVKSIGVSLQLWVYDVHPLDGTSLMPAEGWQSWLDATHKLPDDKMKQHFVKEFSDLSVFDYVLGNSDRGMIKNNFVVGGCPTCRLSRHSPRKSKVPIPIFLHVDQGSSFYHSDAPHGDMIVMLKDKFCRFRKETVESLRKYSHHHHGIDNEVAALVPKEIVSHVGLGALASAQKRLKSLVKHIDACLEKHGADAVLLPRQ